MDEARAALKKSDYPQAVRLLTKVLRYPENAHSAEAQELLGVAYQKNKQLAEARAEYEDYLRRYPTGEAPKACASGSLRSRPRRCRARRSCARPSRPSGGGERGPGQTTWSVSGSASQFYIRDDSFRVVRDPSLPRCSIPTRRTTASIAMRCCRASICSAPGATTSTNRSSASPAPRSTASADDSKEIVSVSALFYETMVRDGARSARVRPPDPQHRRRARPLRRRPASAGRRQPWMRWNVVGGSPVASRRDEPFKDEKVFYGTSVDFGPFFGGFDVSLFAIQQQVARPDRSPGHRHRAALSRRDAIGIPDDRLRHAFPGVQCGDLQRLLDVAGQVDAAWRRRLSQVALPDELECAAGPAVPDPVRAAQAAAARSEIAQMAIDRTATYTSANIGYSRPLTDKLQLNLDATAAQIDGTIASFGVDALPSTGNEFYYSAQLIGSSLFRDGDLFIAGVRFADRQDSNMYVLDFGTRFPLTPDWRINPRLLMSYREGKTTDLTEYSVLPSVLINYYWSKDSPSSSRSARSGPGASRPASRKTTPSSSSPPDTATTSTPTARGDARRRRRLPLKCRNADRR